MITHFIQGKIIQRFMLGAFLLATAPFAAQAAPITFTGNLDVVNTNTGGVYSGVPLGTTFTGTIDDDTANGEISDGTTTTPFSCCMAAGGLELTNDVALTGDDADFLNSLLGSMTFSAGDLIDLIDLEGDAATTGGGRIEVGLSFILAPTAFDNTDPSNYPFDNGDLLLTLFFILEEDANDDIYDAIGLVDMLTLPTSTPPTTPVPLPAAFWLFLSSFGALTLSQKGVRRRNAS